MKNIMELLNNPYIKYPLIVISAIAIIKTDYDLGSFIKKLKMSPVHTGLTFIKLPNEITVSNF
ncbi:hypothetical protein [Bacillus wiedmannii]|uniref:hypothetical protein n=1 Tax=Bacillus wiedmannii TaxID=1890302 RepID=UPI000BF03655|nr:hypothetical protein [Bacillus wiedmannii]PEJ73103.1 hypothetical protein CN888_14810 [Bacillus wiedmannii]PHG44234.1 hypothetical protein COI54_20890 [Bacillus wiedmannii]